MYREARRFYLGYLVLNGKDAQKQALIEAGKIFIGFQDQVWITRKGILALPAAIDSNNVTQNDKRNDSDKKWERVIKKLMILIALFLGGLLLLILLMHIKKLSNAVSKLFFTSYLWMKGLPKMVIPRGFFKRHQPSSHFSFYQFLEEWKRKLFKIVPMRIEIIKRTKPYISTGVFYIVPVVFLYVVYNTPSDLVWIAIRWIICSMITVSVIVVKGNIKIRERRIVFYIGGRAIFFTIFYLDINFTTTNYQHTITV
jgi:hypothetical protein